MYIFALLSSNGTNSTLIISTMKEHRKLRRINFDQIQTEMSVIDAEFLRSIIGGYQNDCFWRCIAYIESGGSSYSESDAAYYAETHFGSGVDLNKRTDGAGMTTEEMSNYITNRYSSESNFNLVQFDPRKAPGVPYGGVSHVVVPIKDITDKKGNVTAIKVYDPQKDTSYEIPANSVIAKLGIRNDGSNGSGNEGNDSSSNSGSSDYSSSSGSNDYGSSDYGSCDYGSCDYGSSDYGSYYYG